MGKYILRRLLLLIPILFGLTVLVFFFIRALPGDPAAAILGERATPEAIERVRTALGLDRPLIDQYLAYMGGIFRLDFGTSFITNRDVTDDFLQRFAGGDLPRGATVLWLHSLPLWQRPLVVGPVSPL